jgi:hypothetical protein
LERFSRTAATSTDLNIDLVQKFAGLLMRKAA